MKVLERFENGFHILNKSGAANTYMKNATPEEKRLDAEGDKILNKICSRCHSHPAVAGKNTCQKCLDYIRNKRKEKGRCSRCSAKLPEGYKKKTCPKCLERMAKRQKTGCHRCGAPLPEGYEKKVCPKCLEKMAEKRKTGCSRCGGKLPEGYKKKVCPRCTKQKAEKRKTGCHRCGKPCTGMYCKSCEEWRAQRKDVHNCHNCGRPLKYNSYWNQRLCKKCIKYFIGRERYER